MGSLASQDFQVARGSKACQGCQDPQVFQVWGNQASQDPKVTVGWGVFLVLLDPGERKDLWGPLEWGVPQGSQACLESQGPWALQEPLVFLDPKEKVEPWGHRGHQVPRGSLGFRVFQASQAFLEK